MLAARTIWNPETADDIAANALQVLVNASRINLRFFNGKTSASLLGGLFYILGYRYYAIRTQHQIAEKLGTSEASVRKSCKNWFKTFPFLFTDVTGKINTISSRIQEKAVCKKYENHVRTLLPINTSSCFDNVLIEAIDETFSILSETVKAVLYFYLENTFHIKKIDFPDKIDCFSAALDKIFGPAASRQMEILLMKKLYVKINRKWIEYKFVQIEWTVPELTFQEYVQLMRQNFEAKQDNKIKLKVLVNE